MCEALHTTNQEGGVTAEAEEQVIRGAEGAEVVTPAGVPSTAGKFTMILLLQRES